MDKEKIGQRIVELRKKKGETQAELANALGLSQSAITMYENGERIPSDVVKKKIAQHFKASITKIFYAD